MRADPSAQLKLLDVQELDSRVDSLRFRLAHLAEAAVLAEQQQEQSEVGDRVRDLQVLVDDLAREQRKADADVEQVKARRTRDQQRLDTGAVSNPKDLAHLQHELVSLDRRVSELEDVELEVMERLDTAQKELAEAQSRLAALEAAIAETIQARDARVAALRKEGSGLLRERAALAAELPADLLTLYDKLRKDKEGVGAALLRARRCGGCSLELNNSDIAVIGKQSPEEVVRCEECGRILVRTAESGL